MTIAPAQEELWGKYRNDRFLIVGFADRTGPSVARVFDAHGIRYRISDLRPLEELRPSLAGLKVAEQDVLWGHQEPGQLDGITRIILSPGVARSSPLIAEAVRKRIPVRSDVDFLYEFIQHKKIVAIAGTDGKTTTASLVAAVLERNGKVVRVCDADAPIFDAYPEILECEWVVLEMSSTMLEDLQQLRPSIACILNIAEDPTDRFASIRPYTKVLQGIIRHCGQGDLFVQNIDDERLRKMEPSHLRVCTISKVRRKVDYFFSEGAFWIRGEPLRFADCLVRGEQNIDNLLAAAAIGCEAGVAPKEVAAALRGCKGVTHRYEYLGRHRAVDVYNDSKASTIHAVDSALRNFECGVVLIMGGGESPLDFSALREHAARIKHLVCYGESGETIREVLGVTSSEYVARFDDAVRRAAARCVAGDILLLSPGCGSGSQHPSCEVRGAAFRDIALQSFHWESDRSPAAGGDSDALVQRLRKKAHHLSNDSRLVEEGTAFIAIPGQYSDGHRYIGEAIRAGATVVVHEFGRDIDGERASHPQVEFIATADPRDFGKLLAPAFYSHPSREMRVVAITGTCGKTSVSLILERLQRALGRNPGVIDSQGIRYNDVTLHLDNVVPEPVVMQRTLRDMVSSRIDTLILALPSYALSIDRVYGIEFDAAILTNIEPAHLDVHGTMDSYVGAKLRMFDGLKRSSKRAKTCATWGSGAFFELIRARARALGLEPVVYDAGVGEGQASLLADRIESGPGGSTFDLLWKGQRIQGLQTPVPGAFHVLNILAALSVEMDEIERKAPDAEARRALLNAVLGAPPSD